MTVLELYNAIAKDQPLRVQCDGNVLRYSYDPKRDENMQRADLRAMEVKEVYPIFDVRFEKNHTSYAHTIIVCEI